MGEGIATSGKSANILGEAVFFNKGFFLKVFSPPISEWLNLQSRVFSPLSLFFDLGKRRRKKKLCVPPGRKGRKEPSSATLKERNRIVWGSVRGKRRRRRMPPSDGGRRNYWTSFLFPAASSKRNRRKTSSSSSSAPFSKMRKAEEDTRSRMKATFNNSQIENNFQVFFSCCRRCCGTLTYVLSYAHQRWQYVFVQDYQLFFSFLSAE